MKYLLTAAAVAAAALLYFLFTASHDTPQLSENFSSLLLIGSAGAVLLLVAVIWQLWLLRRRMRAGVFGSKLTYRLLIWFMVVAVLPGAVVYLTSVYFLNRTIESWFDVRVDRALASGVNLGQAALNDLLQDLNKKAERMAVALSGEGAGTSITLLSNLREQAAVSEATLFDESGNVMAYAGSESSGLLPDIPSRNLLWQVRQQQPYRQVEVGANGDLVMRVLVPVYSSSLTGGTRVLQVIQPVPPGLARDADAVQTTYQEYQQLALSRLGLKRLYGLALTLTLLVALLLTTTLAYLVSERLGAPLRSLARGTRAVAQGDFSQMQPVSSRDELGALIKSFNRMTRQLSEARLQAEHNQQQTEQAKAYLENVLGHLSSGVIALDGALVTRTVNEAAARILGADAASLLGRPLTGWGEGDSALAQFGARAHERFSAGDVSWQEQLDYAAPGGPLKLLVRGSRLPAGMEEGHTLVFDNVTKLIRAERDAAWSEVARRLAHEIKNPLTPIQLAAERLARKLADKVANGDAEFLDRSTQTIVNQVAAMKGMVDAFASYARMPSAHLGAMDLNALVREVLGLYDRKVLGLEVALAENLPPVAGDPALLRQVLHNLLQNAQDALQGEPTPHVTVGTERAEGLARLAVTDNGPGFPEHLMQRLFEPYATSKAKGTGLGLAIVQKIVEEHHGNISVENLQPRGARVTITLPLYEREVS